MQTTRESGAAVCWHPARSPPALGLPPGLCLQGPLCSCRQGPCHPDWALASWGNQSVFLSPPGVLSCCLPVAGRPCWGVIPALGSLQPEKSVPSLERGLVPQQEAVAAHPASGLSLWASRDLCTPSLLTVQLTSHLMSPLVPAPSPPPQPTATNLGPCLCSCLSPVLSPVAPKQGFTPSA